MTIRTAILEARFLLGDRSLFDDADAVRQGSRAGHRGRIRRRQARRARGAPSAAAGQSRYLVEPNVKDGKGGLRDLHTLFWIAKYVYRVREPEELDRAGRVRPRRNPGCSSAARISCGRCAATCTSSPAAPRSGCPSTSSASIAQRLGYSQRPGLRDVERFMKHYFLIAKDVGDLTAILCAALENRQAKPVPMLNRVVAKLRPRGRRVLRESDDFVVDNSRINIADADAFARDPVNLIRIFRLAQRHGLAFHPEALRRATHSLKLIDKTAAGESGGQRAVPGNPHLQDQHRDRAAAHERGRRARPLHSGVRPGRVDDAVQHVSSLYGGRASAALHRRAGGDRERHQSGIRARQRPDAQDPAQSSRGPLFRAVPARHRQRPGRGPLDRRRARRPPSRARASAFRRRRPRPWRGWSSAIW